MNSYPLLFIALDDLAEDEQRTLRMAYRLAFMVEGKDIGFKINLDYVLNPKRGLKTVIKNVQKMKRPVFVDLKMFNGTRTMASVIQNLVDLGVDYLNVYALADGLLPKAIEVAKGSNTKILGVTVLSHFTEAYCQKHFRRSLKATVRHFATVALEAGCNGIIVPGTTLDVVEKLDTTKAVPGVRPVWYQDSRHEQEIEPGVAIEKGASILVCGSPITKNCDPLQGLKLIMTEVAIGWGRLKK